MGSFFLMGARPLVEGSPSMRLHELLDWGAIAAQLKGLYQREISGAGGPEPYAPLGMFKLMLLAAHSLGCLLAAWWAAHSRHAGRVAGALLVAPPDIERADNRQQIPGWAPPARQRLPFHSLVVASSDDPFGSLASAGRLAADWGSDFLSLGAQGHINADSGLGDWDAGYALLLDLGLERSAR